MSTPEWARQRFSAPSRDTSLSHVCTESMADEESKFDDTKKKVLRINHSEAEHNLQRLGYFLCLILVFSLLLFSIQSVDPPAQETVTLDHPDYIPLFSKRDLELKNLAKLRRTTNSSGAKSKETLLRMKHKQGDRINASQPEPLTLTSHLVRIGATESDFIYVQSDLLTSKMNIQNGGFSLSLWLSVTPNTSRDTVESVIWKGSTEIEATPSILLDHTNRIICQFSSVSRLRETLHTHHELPQGVWNHLLYMFSFEPEPSTRGNQLSLFINGSRYLQTPLPSLPVLNSGPLYIGSTPWCKGVRGTIYAAQLFPHALSIDAIKNLYAHVPSMRPEDANR